jgi:hypothetical protein
MVVIACAQLSVAGCGGGSHSAQKDVAPQTRAEPASGSVAAAAAGQPLIWRVAAAAQAAAAGPHGDIGDAAVATAP